MRLVDRLMCFTDTGNAAVREVPVSVSGTGAAPGMEKEKKRRGSANVGGKRRNLAGKEVVVGLGVSVGSVG